MRRGQKLGATHTYLVDNKSVLFILPLQCRQILSIPYHLQSCTMKEYFPVWQRDKLQEQYKMLGQVTPAFSLVSTRKHATGEVSK